MKEEDLETLVVHQAEQHARVERLDGMSLGELRDVAEDENWDEASEEEEKILEEYRRKRMEELKERAQRERFGALNLIAKTDFVNQVTNVKDTWIVVFMFADERVTNTNSNDKKSDLMNEVLQRLAPKFRDVKFVKIRAKDCIPNYPEANLPTLLIYRNGKVQKQFVGLGDFNGMRTTPDDVEWELAQIGVLETELEEAPRTSQSGRVVLNIRRKDYASRVGVSTA
eukprot:TRINITY_DN16794_c0_g1_i1.p1 TRINITY_DN16794_c0_g1~~TRINITY_DN16794_c0_g1_i1.p1  ORF type:complete len:257 (+),score=72.06 TRINITY_DN16794_c0_g1_i1:95-772(+)